ncbi:MAG: hypothetical protein HZA51_04975 [Planctomycetes bacterium]|nr:hypothetical protein [Planctomycetota bacterium]
MSDKVRREAKVHSLLLSQSVTMLAATTFALVTFAIATGGCASMEDRSVSEAYVYHQNEPTSQPASDLSVIRLGMTRHQVREIARNRYSRISRDKSTVQMYRYALPGMWEYWLYFQRSAPEESEDDLLEAIISRQPYTALP